MKTSEYLDKAKELRGLKNDSQLANELNWSRQKISNYRNLDQHMDNEAARQIAEILDIPVITVIADMEAQRVKKPESRKAWAMLAKMTAQQGFASTNLLLLLSFFSWAIQKCILCKINDVEAYV